MRSIIHQTGRKGSYLEWNLRFINNYSQKLARNGAEKKSRRGTFSWAKETSWQAPLIFFLILLFYSTVAVRPISHKRRTAWRNRLDENRKSFVQKKLYVRNENTRQSVPIVHFVLVFLLQIARFKWVDGNTSTIPPQSFYYQPCPGGVSCSVRCGFRSCLLWFFGGTLFTCDGAAICRVVISPVKILSRFHKNRAFAPPRSRGERKKVWSLNRLSCLGKKSQPWFGYVICLSCSDLFFLQVGLRPLVKSYHRVGGPSEPNEIEIIIKKNI